MHEHERRVRVPFRRQQDQAQTPQSHSPPRSPPPMVGTGTQNEGYAYRFVDSRARLEPNRPPRLPRPVTALSLDCLSPSLPRDVYMRRGTSGSASSQSAATPNPAARESQPAWRGMAYRFVDSRTRLEPNRSSRLPRPSFPRLSPQPENLPPG